MANRRAIKPNGGNSESAALTKTKLKPQISTTASMVRLVVEKPIGEFSRWDCLSTYYLYQICLPGSNSALKTQETFCSLIQRWLAIIAIGWWPRRFGDESPVAYLAYYYQLVRGKQA